jgi:hypothetical protein
MLFGDLPANTTKRAADTDGPGGDDDPPPAAAPSAQPPLELPPAPSRPGAPVHHPLWLGFAERLIVVPEGSKEKVQLRGLTLLELGQGQGAGEASTLLEPAVWTHLIWAIIRSVVVCCVYLERVIEGRHST